MPEGTASSAIGSSVAGGETTDRRPFRGGSLASGDRNPPIPFSTLVFRDPDNIQLELIFSP